jgi:hypothetical protein
MILETVILALGISSVVSYETTGKGLADHAISTVSSQDCKIARVMKGDDVCQPESSVTVSAAPSIFGRDSAVDAMERVFAQRKAGK